MDVPGLEGMVRHRASRLALRSSPGACAPTRHGDTVTEGPSTKPERAMRPVGERVRQR